MNRVVVVVNHVVDTKKTTTGVIISTYRPAEPVAAMTSSDIEDPASRRETR